MTSSPLLTPSVTADGGYRYAASGMVAELLATVERHGLTSLRATGSEAELVRRDPPLFALNAYRLFCTGRQLAYARREPFDASLDGGALVLRWRPTERHPVRLTARYEVRSPATIDLTLEATAEQPLGGYELYISSYFDFSLSPAMVVPTWAGRPEPLQLLPLEGSPFLHGNYIVAPRDGRTLAQLFDGRWDGPDGRPVVRWAKGQDYGRPIAVMGCADLHLVQLARAEECIRVMASYADANPKDSIAHHNALYLSFWGTDVAPGERRIARVRQVLQPGPATLQGVLALHDTFLAETAPA